MVILFFKTKSSQTHPWSFVCTIYSRFICGYWVKYLFLCVYVFPDGKVVTSAVHPYFGRKGYMSVSAH